jgi:hypothetical protein
MAFGLRYRCDVVWIPDGAGGMSVPDAQVLTLFPTSSNPTGLTADPQTVAPVPGGDAPTAANFATAFTNIATDLAAQLAAGTALLARVQAFATGGG